MIDEADKIQRTIDELNKDYDSITAPHPDTAATGADDAK
jgi:hypothetical protein